MNDKVNESQVSEGGEAGGGDASAAKKTKTEYTTVKMSDGREVQFAGKRKVQREVLQDADGKPNGVRFDYVNGHSHSIRFDEIPQETVHHLLAHGISQKVGDEAAGTKEVDDVVLAHADMMSRLKKGEFYAQREPGDSFAGASLVIKAICEATNKSVEDIKKFLDGKLEKAKADGQKLTRADLYASFRNPNSKTGQIIERLEREERAKRTVVNADDLLAEVTG